MKIWWKVINSDNQRIQTFHYAPLLWNHAAQYTRKTAQHNTFEETEERLRSEATWWTSIFPTRSLMRRSYCYNGHHHRAVARMAIFSLHRFCWFSNAFAVSIGMSCGSECITMFIHDSLLTSSQKRTRMLLDGWFITASWQNHSPYKQASDRAVYSTQFFFWCLLTG